MTLPVKSEISVGTGSEPLPDPNKFPTYTAEHEKSLFEIIQKAEILRGQTRGDNSNLSDEQELLFQKEAQAITEITHRYTPGIIFSINKIAEARPYLLNLDDKNFIDELRREGMLALIEAIRNFPRKGKDIFFPYAADFFRKRIIKKILYERHREKQEDLLEQELNQLIKDQGQTKPPYERVPKK